jgi:trk system potassium uptake protein TrkA
MINTPQVCVIGLGKFGYKLGINLLEQGHKVVGIDSDHEAVARAQKHFTQVFEAEATQKQALEQIRISDMTHVLVSVGDSIAASTMITMYLKELGVPNVWVKATNEDHGKLLTKIGADQVMIPEHIAARRLADQIAIPGVLQRLTFDADMIIRELEIDRFAGKSIREIDLTNRYNVQIIAVKKQGAPAYKYIPRAEDRLSRGDNLIVIGTLGSLSQIKP